MSKFTSVVAGVVGPDQAGTIYGCTDDTIKIRRFAYDGSTMGMSISTGSGSLESNRGIAVVVQPPNELYPEGITRIFVTREGNHHTCHVADPGGTDDVNASLEEAGFGLASAFGAAAAPDGVVLVGFDPTSGGSRRLRWAYCTWDDLEMGAFVNTTWSTIDVTDIVGSRVHDDHCELRLAIVRDAQGGLRAVMVSTWKGSSHYHLMAFQAVLDENGTPVGGLSTAGLDYQIPSSDQRYENIQLQQSPMGSLFFSGYTGSGAQTWTCPIQDRVGTWSGPDALSASGFDDPDSVAYVPLWIPGPLRLERSASNPDLDDALMPLRTATLAIDGSGFTASISSRDAGTLRRRALTCTPEIGVRVLGIIAGPPPMPIENLDMPKEYDTFTGGAPAAGSTQWSVGKDTTAQVQVTWGVGIGGSYTTRVEEQQKVEVMGVQFGEESAYAQFQTSLKMMYQGAYEHVTHNSQLQTVECTAAITGTAPGETTQGNYAIEPTGKAVTAQVTWTGYTYEFVDVNGNVPDGALSFTTLFPSSVEHGLPSFALAPSVYGRPGDLQSYHLSSSDLHELDAAAVPLGDGTYLEFGWSYNGSLETKFSAYTENTWTNGFSLDLESSLGFGGSVGLLGISESTDVTISGQLTFGVNSRQSEQNSVGIQSHVQVRGSSSAPGVYRSYNWRVYQLEASETWFDEFRASLEEPVSDPTLSSFNRELLESLGTNSKPWLIRYAVTSFVQN